jgi:hypothetical protein
MEQAEREGWDPIRVLVEPYEGYTGFDSYPGDGIFRC